MVKDIEFVDNGINYKAKAYWSGGATGAGFYIEIEEPIKKITKSVKYYSTHDGKISDNPLDEIYKELILDTINE